MSETYKKSTELSCNAMKELARAEVMNNFDILRYSINDHRCRFFTEDMNRYEESLLQHGANFSKNACIEKNDLYGRGVWENQFDPTRNPMFDQWTRAKMHSKCQKKTDASCVL